MNCNQNLRYGSATRYRASVLADVDKGTSLATTRFAISSSSARPADAADIPPPARVILVKVRSPAPIWFSTVLAWADSGNSAASARSPLTTIADVDSASASSRYCHMVAPLGQSRHTNGKPPVIKYASSTSAGSEIPTMSPVSTGVSDGTNISVPRWKNARPYVFSASIIARSEPTIRSKMRFLLRRRSHCF